MNAPDYCSGCHCEAKVKAALDWAYAKGRREAFEEALYRWNHEIYAPVEFVKWLESKARGEGA